MYTLFVRLFVHTKSFDHSTNVGVQPVGYTVLGYPIQLTPIPFMYEFFLAVYYFFHLSKGLLLYILVSRGGFLVIKLAEILTDLF